MLYHSVLCERELAGLVTPAVQHHPTGCVWSVARCRTEPTHSAAPPEHTCIQCNSGVNLGSMPFLTLFYLSQMHVFVLFFLKLKFQSMRGTTFLDWRQSHWHVHTYFVACRCYLFSLQKVSGERLSRAKPRRLPWEDKQQGLGKRQAENRNRWPLPGPHPLTWYKLTHIHTHIHSKCLSFPNADQSNRWPGGQASCLFCSKKTVKGYLYHCWAFHYNVKMACYSYRRLKQNIYIENAASLWLSGAYHLFAC